MQKRNLTSNESISQVIATLLLVLLAISLGISLYHFYSSVKEETEASAGATVKQDITGLTAGVKVIRVDPSSPAKIYIQNTGGRTLHNIKVYINYTEVGENNTLDVSSLWVFTYNGNLNSGDVIYITTIERASDRYELQ
ncbi:hypothetical protein BMS3Bbin15_01913 [archaeon BMS3Bbin15]|nr:hypothetical protein BMS3Bbin15_01913 [archaeon BMS3Bbin15]